jgi:hypothetical protein
LAADDVFLYAMGLIVFWVLIQDLGKNLFMTSAHINDLVGWGNVVGFQQANDMKRGKAWEWAPIVA